MRWLLVLGLMAGCLWGQKQVAITIDDLPRGGDAKGNATEDREMTIKLLTPFKLRQIPLTGFVNGCRRPEDNGLLALWAAAGADLGNHTCSHVDLNSTSIEQFEADTNTNDDPIMKGLGRPPRFFRYPYLHTGPTEAIKEKVAAFLEQRGYLNAPVTVDDDDYIYARVYADDLAAGKSGQAAQLKTGYVQYMSSIFAFFEGRARTVTGHEVKQILLIHASQLNADAMPELLRMLERRGYEFISLTEALTDEAYQMTDGYVGTNGISWIHRWGLGRGMKIEWEPDPPAAVMTAYKQSGEK